MWGNKMTEDEMAKEYCNNEVPFDTTESGEKLYTENDLKYAYLTGFKAGKPKRHKVADGDYPPCERGNYSINILTDRGEIAYYNYDMECWMAEPSSAEIDPPIAWCEIPKYEE